MVKLAETLIECPNVALAHNGPAFGEEADLEAQTFSLVQKPIGSTNVQFSTKPAFLPSVCYALVAFFKQ